MVLRADASMSIEGRTSLDKLTYISIGAGGTLSGDLHTTSSDIDAILEYVSGPAVQKVVLHFHGGLVNTEAGELTAARMVPLYRDRARSHPVVFIWQTGFLETVEDNIRQIRETKLFQKILAYAVQQLAKRLHIPIPGRGAGQAESIPEIEAKIAVPGGLQSYDVGARGGAQKLKREQLPMIQTEAEAEVDEQLENELLQDPGLEAILRIEVPNTKLLDKNAVIDPKAPPSRGFISVTKLAVAIGKIVFHVAERYIDHHDHGFGPTVVEETLRELYLADLGAWVWSGIKDLSEKMWLPNDKLTGKDLHGGYYLLEGLARVQNHKPTLNIDLVGHSAGSIAICHLLKTAAISQLTLKIRNIIFMAPACTSALFLDEIVRHPKRFANFRMFTMNNQFEEDNHLVSIIYERSLLYLVAGILESQEDTPIAGMMRFCTGAPPFDSPNLNEVKNFLFPQNGQRLVLSRTSVTAPLAPEGFRSNATRHQDFNTDDDTLNSLVAMIKPN
jgi:Alpha/beta hydrolase of unknown function (DUF900)